MPAGGLKPLLDDPDIGGTQSQGTGGGAKPPKTGVTPPPGGGGGKSAGGAARGGGKSGGGGGITVNNRKPVVESPDPSHNWGLWITLGLAIIAFGIFAWQGGLKFWLK